MSVGSFSKLGLIFGIPVGLVLIATLVVPVKTKGLSGARRRSRRRRRSRAWRRGVFGA